MRSRSNSLTPPSSPPSGPGAAAAYAAKQQQLFQQQLYQHQQQLYQQQQALHERVMSQRGGNNAADAPKSRIPRLGVPSKGSGGGQSTAAAAAAAAATAMQSGDVDATTAAQAAGWKDQLRGGGLTRGMQQNGVDGSAHRCSWLA